MKDLLNRSLAFMRQHKAFTIVAVIAGLLVFHSAVNNYHSFVMAIALSAATVFFMYKLWAKPKTKKVIVIKERKRNKYVYW